MKTHHKYFATVPLNMERQLVRELEELGAKEVQHTVAVVYFEGTLEVGYRAVLWTRLANRVILQLKEVPAQTADELYEGVKSIDWSEHMDVDSTLKVTFTSVRLSSDITHSKYGALRVKDAVVDQFRERQGKRPSVELDEPDLHINCHIDGSQATLSIDLAGSSLHRRSYRKASGGAPLKENVAAAILMRANWPEIASEGRPLVDPMCGSGTLLIEGAMMAADHAPGLLRSYFGLQGWKQHDQELWQDLLAEARERAMEGKKKLPMIVGRDRAWDAFKSAKGNLRRAGLEDHVELERAELAELEPPGGRGAWPGLVITNAPYGERLGSEKAVEGIHRLLGEVLKERFGGWQASVLTGSEELGRKLGMSADKIYQIYNGPLECLLLNFQIFER